MRLLNIPPEKYDILTPNQKIKRAKLFLKLVTMLELEILGDPDKIRNYVDIHLYEDDFEYMNIEELLLMRCQGFLDNLKIFELFPEEFDFLDGVPVLMWDQL